MADSGWNALRANLEMAFGAGREADAVPRIGAEVELIPFSMATHHVPAAHGSDGILSFLETYGSGAGWRSSASAKGAPKYHLPGGGALTLEPGGQLEYSSPPFPSPSALLRAVRSSIAPLVEAAGRQGITLLGVGIDPYNRLEQVPLQFRAERYLAMDAYFATTGDGGQRMMRQTASVQINVDAPAGEMLRAWRVLQAMAPWLTAVFANSAVYAGERTEYASYRAQTWRQADPLRTGILPCVENPVEEYLAFALAAPAMFFPRPAGRYRPIRELLSEGAVGMPEWEDHLSTLFPEVRPRGHLEVRSVDALPIDLVHAPVLLVAGIVMDVDALHETAELLGSPDSGLLSSAGRRGMRDPDIAAVAGPLFDIALRALARRGTDFCAPGDLEDARAFADWFTARGRMPGDEALEPAGAPGA